MNHIGLTTGLAVAFWFVLENRDDEISSLTVFLGSDMQSASGNLQKVFVRVGECPLLSSTSQR